VARYKDYQERAAECLRLAQSMNDPAHKALLLEMAQTWVRLAEQAQREDCGKKRIWGLRPAERHISPGQASHMSSI
jgi:hypothetical protein